MPIKIRLKDLTFGRLRVLKQVPPPRTNTFWRCRCVCGRTVIVTGGNLRSGRSRSCGCLKRELMLQRFTKHGACHTPEYRCWISAKNRCYNQKSQDYVDYGGRGITMCEAWRRDFLAFRSAVGPRPSTNHSLDRIDVNRGYEPGNVRWATATEQANNKRGNHRLNLGETQPTCADVDRSLGARPGVTKQRKQYGWSDERAATQPLRQHHYLTLDGITRTLTEWAKSVGVAPETLRKRLRLGWSVRHAVTTTPGALHRYSP